ncbi:hypothetical protein EMPS_09699 [Entomortierella parvispora]|uniref:Uncharacterized protein n=1 Tax=Entomortierella parvispora TaxID=205924 RepID=A0A9P3HIJ0_9FUNG|nr:hypothetical protein EMPS_09699 [Entomortierella parvispora]
MDSTTKPSQGYISHSETESWAVTATVIPVISPEIRLGPVRIRIAISERSQTDKFLTLTVSRASDDTADIKPAETTKKAREEGSGSSQKTALPSPESSGKESAVVAGGQTAGSSPVDLEITIYSGCRKVSIGHVTIKDILRADKRAFELTNILLRADLPKYHSSLVLDFCVHGLPVSRPRSLTALWQDASTADVVIQCTGSESFTQVLVHKAYVLDQIPELALFLNLNPISPSFHRADSIYCDPDQRSNPGGSDFSGPVTDDEDVASESANSTNVLKETGAHGTLGSGPQQQHQPSEETPLSKRERRNRNHQQKMLQNAAVNQPISRPRDPSSLRTVSTVSREQEELANCLLSESEYVVPLTSSSVSHPASSSSPPSDSSDEAPTALESAGPTIHTASSRSRIEVWNWPNHFPPTSCYQVMAWIYRQELPSEEDFQLQEFESLMVLCKSLKQQELYHRYAELAETMVLSHTRPVSLFKLLDYNARHAQQYLKPVLIRRVIESPGLLFKDPEIMAHILEVDPSGIIYDVLRSKLGSF